jgi:guanylate kinase
MSTVFTICATFKSNESSVASRVCQLLDGIELATPYTTRHRRSAEDDGFVFTSQDAFNLMIAREELLEYVQVFGNYYGTPRSCLQEARERGNDLLIRVDERAATQVKQKLSDAISILVLQPPSHQDERSTETGSELLLSQRLRDASRMIDPEKFDHVVSAESSEENANRVAAIIRFERSRQS